MYLSYKHNNVQCQILDEKNESIFLINSECTLDTRDNCKLESFRKAILFLSSKGFKGILKVKLVGKYFEKWVKGISVPPSHLLVNTFRAIKALDLCLFSVEFCQVSRVNKLAEIEDNGKDLNILDLMQELDSEEVENEE